MATLDGSFPAKAFDDFSKKEVIDFLEILHYACQASTEEHVGKVLNLIKRLIPCRHMIAGQLRPDPEVTSGGVPRIVNMNYPDGWTSLYLKNRHTEVTRVLPSFIPRRSKTQRWAKTLQHAGSPKGPECAEDVHEFSLLTGLTAGKCDRTLGLSSFFSFTGDAASLPPRYRPALEYLSTYLHEALLRIARPSSTEAIDVLSPREKTVLKWMRYGKTNWEISKILGVSERTVRFHIEGIFNKLHVTSRTQAVAYAVENGLQAAQ